MVTSSFERNTNLKKNERRKKLGFKFPMISVSYRNKDVLQDLAYLGEKSINVSDWMCKLVRKEVEIMRARDSNNNMTYYMEEHQRRLLTLPKIQDYLKYLNEGNPSITKLFESAAINEQDINDIWRSTNKLHVEIEGHPKMNLLVKTKLLEELKYGTKA